MSERDKAKQEALMSFRKGSTKEERAKAFMVYLKEYVQPAITEKTKLVNPYSKKSPEELISIFDGKLV